MNLVLVYCREGLDTKSEEGPYVSPEKHGKNDSIINKGTFATEPPWPPSLGSEPTAGPLSVEGKTPENVHAGGFWVSGAGRAGR